MKPKALTCLAAFMFLLTPAVSAQVTKDTQQGGRIPRGKAALRITMRNKARALAATYHFAALKIARARMIAEFYAKNPQGDGEPQPDVVRIAEEELYRVLAGSLTQFIQQFDGTPEAQAARVITARLLLHINEIPDAVAILDDFDWGDARVGDILGAVELSEFFRIQKIQTAPLLLRAAGDAGSIEEQMDVLLLALRLNNDGSDLPTRILKIIEGSAESVNDKAAVILGQAELVFRLTPAIVEPLGTPGEPQADTGGVDTGKQPGRDTGGTDQGQAREPIAGQPQPAGMPVKNQSGTVDGSLPRDLSGADDGIFTRIPGDVPDTAGYIESIQRIALKRPIRTVPIEPGVVGIDPGDIAGQPIGSGISGVQGSAGTPDEIAGQAKLYVDLLGTVAQKFPSTPAAIVAVRRLMAFRLDAGMDGIPFDGVTDDGSEIQLSDFAGEVLLLDFWSTGSIESLADRPKIAALYDTYHANGLDIVSINLDDDADVWIAKALTADLDMDWHNVIEGTGLHSIFARSYNVDGTPHRVLIDGEGDVIATDEDLDFNGGGIESAIQRAILALKPVPVDDNPIIIIDEEPYSGPEFKATLEIDGSDVAGAVPIKGEAPQYAVNVSVDVITGGWELRHDQNIVIGGVTQVRFTLVSPNPDDMNIQVIETKRLHIPLGSQVSDQIQIRVARTIRGVIYDEYPPYLLAGTVSLPSQAYDGPAVTTEFGSTDDIPPSHFVSVSVEVTTGGYGFSLDEIKHVASVPGGATQKTQVYLTLSSPGPGEIVTQIVETKKVFVELGKNVGKTVEILIRQTQRASGSAGEYALAKSVELQ